jgi:hypothetical protein
MQTESRWAARTGRSTIASLGFDRCGGRTFTTANTRHHHTNARRSPDHYQHVQAWLQRFLERPTIIALIVHFKHIFSSILACTNASCGGQSTHSRRKLCRLLLSLQIPVHLLLVPFINADTPDRWFMNDTRRRLARASCVHLATHAQETVQIHRPKSFQSPFVANARLSRYTLVHNLILLCLFYDR